MTSSRVVRLLVLLALPLLLAASLPRSAAAEEPPLPMVLGADAVPVPRPGTREAARTVPIGPFLQAESEYAAGRRDEALSHFLDLAYSSPDGERKGFVWMRIGEILLARGELDKALEAADKAVQLSRARYLVLCAVDLKLRIYQKMNWNKEAGQMASYLLDQKFADADVPALLALVARADAEAGKTRSALSLYGRAIAATSDPQAVQRFSDERDALVEGMTNLSALRAAGNAETDADVRADLFLTMGKVALRSGFLGMATYAFDRSARGGGKRSPEAAEYLYRLEKITAARPKIVGLVPLSGKFADVGFSVLSGAEVALGVYRRNEPNVGVPVLRWVDTAAQPSVARKEFLAAAADETVIGILGPVTGEEGRSIGAAFSGSCPPTLYLGQKTILSRPFLYAFGLSPVQEARAVLSRLSKDGVSELLLFFPENGYGRGYADAVLSTAKDAGVHIAKVVSYPPETRDFTDVIKRAVGNAAFRRYASSKEKGEGIRLPRGGIVIADRGDRVFLLASQLQYYNVFLPLAGFSGWYDGGLLGKGGSAVSGALFSVDYSDAIPGSEGDRFRKEYQDAMRASPTRFEAMGYDGARLFADAFAQQAGGVDRVAASMREAILRMRTFNGVTGEFLFTPSGDLQRKVSLLRVELGNFVPVQGP